MTTYALARPRAPRPRRLRPRGRSPSRRGAPLRRPRAGRGDARCRRRSCGSRPSRSPPWPGCNAFAPASASTTPPSASSSTSSTGSPGLEAAQRRRPPAAPHRRTTSTMDMNRLTQKSQEALHDAQTKALRFGHTEVDGEHLLLALLDQPDGLVPRLVTQAGADADRLRAELEGELSRRPRVSGPGSAPGQVFLTQRLGRLLDAAEGEAKRLKDEYVSVEHLVLALLAEGSATAAGRVLAAQGLTRDTFLQGAHRDPRQPAGDVGDARGHLRGVGEVRPRPRQRGQDRQARPRHRAGHARSGASSRSCPARRRTTRS